MTFCFLKKIILNVPMSSKEKLFSKLIPKIKES